MSLRAAHQLLSWRLSRTSYFKQAKANILADQMWAGVCSLLELIKKSENGS